MKMITLCATFLFFITCSNFAQEPAAFIMRPQGSDYVLEEKETGTVLGELTLQEKGYRIAGDHVTTMETAPQLLYGKRFVKLANESGSYERLVYNKKLGGLVSYATSVKKELLRVSTATIDANGVVSEATVVEMAERARELFRSDYSVATSGYAGPTGGTEEAPVGTVWIAVTSKHGEARAWRFYDGEDSRGAIIEKTVRRALEKLAFMIETASLEDTPKDLDVTEPS